jgi:hypothetical protein
MHVIRPLLCNFLVRFTLCLMHCPACIHTHIHTHAHQHSTHTYTYYSMHACCLTDTHTHTYMYVYVCVHIRHLIQPFNVEGNKSTYIHICIHTRMQSNHYFAAILLASHIHIRIRIRIAYAYTYTYAYMHACNRTIPLLPFPRFTFCINLCAGKHTW